MNAKPEQSTPLSIGAPESRDTAIWPHHCRFHRSRTFLLQLPQTYTRTIGGNDQCKVEICEVVRERRTVSPSRLIMAETGFLTQDGKTGLATADAIMAPAVGFVAISLLLGRDGSSHGIVGGDNGGGGRSGSDDECSGGGFGGGDTGSSSGDDSSGFSGGDSGGSSGGDSGGPSSSSRRYKGVLLRNLTSFVFRR
ncbi:hypothetical protein PM082_022174 [Marasmius tenuissimus]|nr:hypothetical protein PM082_022174 [Marasmius tenuissimus]